jgi:hypothetical protein
MARNIKTPEVFTLIDSITYTWHNEYVIDAERPLSPAQVALVDTIVAEVNEHICAFDNEGDCLTETTSSIGFQLYGDRDEHQMFHAFYVSDERAICCECAFMQNVVLAA